MKKTKKALLAALACSIALAGGIGLVACNGGDSGSSGGGEGTSHSHSYGSWTSNNNGTHNGTCANTDGKCDALTLTNDTCDTTGTDGACSKCGYKAQQGGETHSHVWGEWEVETAPTLYGNGLAIRECTGEGDCDATEELTQHLLPGINTGLYDYAEPTHKTDATCEVQGADTYVYANAESEISVSFDVETGYGDHVFDENDECTVCHKTVTALELNTEVTVNATAEESLYSFTAATEGKYEIISTEDNEVGVVVNKTVITQLPYSITLSAGEKVTLSISAPDGEESATYKIKVIPVTVLAPDYGTEENPVDPTEVPATATVNVGGGKTARVDVRGSGYGILSYTGETPIVVTYSEYVWGKGNVEHTYTLVGGAQEYCVLDFGYPIGGESLTISSEAEEAFDAEISLLLSEEDPGEEGVISLDVEKEFENLDMEGKVYSIEIAEEGEYKLIFDGVAASEVYLTGGSKSDELAPIELSADGTITLPAGTYYIGIASNNEDPENQGEFLPISGTITVSKVVAEGDNPTVGEAFTVSGLDPDDMWACKKLTIELEAGNYKVLIGSESVEWGSMTVAIGSGYEASFGGQELVPLDYKKYMYIPEEGEPFETDDYKVVVVETAGTYYLEVYSNITFTIVKEAE